MNGNNTHTPSIHDDEKLNSDFDKKSDDSISHDDDDDSSSSSNSSFLSTDINGDQWEDVTLSEGLYIFLVFSLLAMAYSM